MTRSLTGLLSHIIFLSFQFRPLPKIMFDSSNYAASKAGSPPGDLVYVGDAEKVETKITFIEYDKCGVREEVTDSIDLALNFKDTSRITWINVDGLHDVGVIRKIGEYINIHPLILEDILNTDQRPKAEIFDDYIYIVLKRISSVTDEFEIKYSQVSIVAGINFVITFKETGDDIFSPLKKRLEDSKRQIRKLGSDYLMYSIIDLIVDQYFTLQESIDDFIENIEEELLSAPTPDILNSIHHLKKEMIFLRRVVFPLRALMTDIMREESPLIQSTVKLYFTDVHDHVIRLCESIEIYRDLISGLLNIYVSSLNNKTNEIMKVLTIFSSIFIPLTFITGIYGMNFEHMPELKFKWAYPVLLIIIFIVVFLTLFVFKKKKWL